MSEELICIVCPNSCRLRVKMEAGELQVKGAKCKRGIDFAKTEIKNPKRVLCTTVKTAFSDYPLLSVRTSGEIPKDLLQATMKELKSFVLTEKVKIGEVLIENILDTGCAIIATDEIE